MTEENTGKTRVQLSIKFASNGSGYAIVESNTAEGMLEEGLKLMDSAKMLNTIVEAIQAEATIREVFPNTERVSPQSTQQPGTPAGPPADVCAHGVPREHRGGFKNGKKWGGMFCVVKNDPRLAQCAVEWD